MSHLLLFVGLRNYGIGMYEILIISGKKTGLLIITEELKEIATSHRSLLAMTE
jgi:hypothetical protein